MKHEATSAIEPLTPSRIARALRMRSPVGDRSFDRFLRHDVRGVSAMYWTPLAVIARAAQWLDDVNARTVLDIGSGAGKFCVGSALASSSRFIGLEHRARLVSAARELARVFEVDDRVTFVHCALDADPVVAADA
jgi:tRNA G46 methylase TrmB